MRPAKVQKVQRALHQAGWRLSRVSGRQHYIFASPSGQLLTLNLHGNHAIDRYTTRHLQRDVRRDKRRRKQGRHAG